MNVISTKQYSADELGLIEALAVAMSQRLRLIFAREKGMGSGNDWCIYHLHTGDFERACNTLWSLGLAAPCAPGQSEIKFVSRKDYNSDVPKRFPVYFAIFSEKDVRRLFQKQSHEDWPPTEEIIQDYINIATDYGKSSDTHLPTPKDEPFLVTHPDQIAPMEAFVRNGFAKKLGGHFIWTDLMTPLMVKNWYWDETMIHWRSIDPSKISAQALAVLSSLETSEMAELRKDLQQMSVAFRGLEMMLKWNGKSWTENALEEPFLSFDEAMAISLETEFDV